MGNYRFRLSDMMPNAWFYKLKDMGGRARNHGGSKKKHHHYQISPTSTTTQTSRTKQTHHHVYPRKSYYFTRELTPSDRFYASPTNNTTKKPTDSHDFPVEPPRKSSRQRSRKRNMIRSSPPKVAASSVSAGCSCRATLWNKADSLPEYSASSSSLSSSDTSNSDQKLCDESSPQDEFRSDCILTTESSFDDMVSSWSRSCTCKDMDLKANNDMVVIDADDDHHHKYSPVKKFEKLGDDLVKLPEVLELPPIITKPTKFNDMVKKDQQNNESTKYRRSSAKLFEEKNAHGSLSVKVVKEERITVKENKNKNNNNSSSPVRKFPVNSPGGVGVRLRINSPKIASRRLIQSHARKSVSSGSSSTSRRKSLSDSFAVVKSSFDPQRDFRDSMVEMIMEHNIRTSKDLEDLLACFLSLNSDEYHDIIIKVFKQIWFDLSDVRLK
ncbi:hypothetical protein PTKIN_Ptkin09bG0290400 [Pterospermum kingtungense]